MNYTGSRCGLSANVIRQNGENQHISSEYEAHLGKLLQHKEHSINAAKEERQQMKGNYRKHNYGKYTLRTHHICVCVGSFH